MSPNRTLLERKGAINKKMTFITESATDLGTERSKYTNMLNSSSIKMSPIHNELLDLLGVNSKKIIKNELRFKQF
jgi:hypothetical protein